MKTMLLLLLFVPVSLASCVGKKESDSKEGDSKEPKTEVESAPAAPAMLSTEDLRQQQKLDETAIAALEDKSSVYRYSSGYNLEDIPAEILAIKTIQTIELNNYRGKTLPSALKDMPKLQVLYLSGANSLEALPEFIAEMPNLKTIAINNAAKLNLSHAIDVLSKNPNIEHVQITYSSIDSEIPASIGNMANLKTLDISNNSISAFNESMFRLPNLQTLMISSQKDKPYDYTALLVQLKSLPKLSKLSIYYAGLTDFPETLKEYPALESINWREDGKGWENTDAITKTKEKMQAKFPNISFPLAPYESLFYDFY
jgi:Leucine-rich repeat (LRR) protein